MRYIKILFVFLLFLSPVLYSQDITISPERLEVLINEEVAKKIDDIVDSAVAVAVKAEEEKYLLIIAEKDKLIVDLNAEIDKRDNTITVDSINFTNLQLDFSAYKSTHGIKRDLTIGGISFGTGGLIGAVLGIVTTLKFQ